MFEGGGSRVLQASIGANGFYPDFTDTSEKATRYLAALSPSEELI